MAKARRRRRRGVPVRRVVVMSRTRRTSPPPVARVEAHLGSERPSILVFVVEQSIAARLAGRARERLAQRALPQVLHPGKHDGGLPRAPLVPDAPQRARAPLERGARQKRRAQRERGRRGGGVRAREDDAEAHRGQGRDMERFRRVTRATRIARVTRRIGDEHDAGQASPVRVRARLRVVRLGLDVQVEPQETLRGRRLDGAPGVVVAVVV